MGLKAKLVASVEVKCEGHSIHDMYHTNTYHICNISSVANHVEIHEGEIFKVGAVVSWKYIEDMIQEKIIRETPEPDPADSDHEDIESRSDENDLSIDQFNQHYDPNEDNDSGMSFDSIALHNLDT
ncbi:hypothetical protein H5410_064102 [Solanum commersonii]|uniref:Bet v I/Major latex protein domain-containing protein n=1 Tax=Solanum commersonii TaxID=4109 RepID=A0A9J5W0J4_SOLCO|nr:hypothetical protein H5410_064102 [Solanum commersonii]